jgi:hypothetical protein
MTATVVDDLTFSGNQDECLRSCLGNDLSVDCDDVIYPNRTATGHFYIRRGDFLFCIQY